VRARNSARRKKRNTDMEQGTSVAPPSRSSRRRAAWVVAALSVPLLATTVDHDYATPVDVLVNTPTTYVIGTIYSVDDVTHRGHLLLPGEARISVNGSDLE